MRFRGFEGCLTKPQGRPNPPPLKTYEPKSLKACGLFTMGSIFLQAALGVEHRVPKWATDADETENLLQLLVAEMCVACCGAPSVENGYQPIIKIANF